MTVIPKPSNILLSQTAATCSGATANNNGSIQLTAVSDGTHFGLSTLNAVSYNGPTTIASATTISLPHTLITGVPNTGGTYILRIFNAQSDCYYDQTIYVYPVYCQDPCTSTLGGTAWLDYDSDGVQDAAETQGQSGVTVKIYDCNGNLVATEVTDYYGDWHYDGAVTYPVRVEYSNLPTGASSTFNGTNSATSVQFVSAASCAVDMGVQYGADYCQTNPPLATNCYVNGNNSSGTSGAGDVLVKFDYNNTGFTPSPTHIGYASEAGTTWGLAYQRETGKLFSSAYIKRHAGLGPQGTGGIYITDVAAGTTTNFVNLASLGISTGADPHGTLPSDKTQPSQDSLAFYEVGKRAFGDMDISDDGKYLFVVNAFTKELHRIFINNPATVPTAGDITTYSIPNPCSNSDNRPFALKYKDGKLYVGVTCSAETTQDRNDLTASVYVLDLTTGTFSASPVLSFPLNYTRGRTWRPTAQSSLWYPWLTDWTQVFVDGSNAVVTYPQPMLTDIEFDADGSMLLGIRDRIGDQLGVFNHYPNNVYMSAEAVAGGDILRAAPNTTGSAWLLEYNGRVGSLTSGAANAEGIGGSEFYKGDLYVGGEPVYGHYETSNGGLAILRGTGEIAMTAVDPPQESYGFQGYNSAGIRFMSNTNGSLLDGYVVYDSDTAPGTFQKSGGLGDVELLCNPAPLQIGNYVWIDTDKDGVQDPCETGLSGVNVNLYKMDGGTTTLIASTTTNGSGQYYFKDYYQYGAGFDTLETGKMYFVVIGEGGQFNTSTEILTISGFNYQLTSQNTGEGTNPDLNDSDAYLYTTAGKPFTGYPVDTITIGEAGTVDHTLDFGLMCVEPDLSVSPNTVAVCAPVSVNLATAFTLTDANNTTAASGYPKYYASQSDATNDVNDIGSTVTSAGTYWIRKNTTAGCWDTVRVTVVLNPNPDFTLALATVCPGANPEVTINSLTNGTPAASTMQINTGSFLPYVASPPNLTTADGIIINTTNTVTVRNEHGCETSKNIAVPDVVPLVCPPVILTRLKPASLD